MVEQLTGATTVLVVILAYVLCLQAMMAAICLLGQFLVLSFQKLLAMIGEPQSDSKSEQLPYKLGGGLARWE
jgi:hypothetical protein